MIWYRFFLASMAGMLFTIFVSGCATIPTSLQPQHYFTVETDPQGAIITLDNKYVGWSPCRVKETIDPQGHQYVIRAHLDGYEDGVATYDNVPPYPAIRDTLIKLKPLRSESLTPQPQQQKQTVVIPETGDSSTDDCITRCKIMFLKAKLNIPIEECYKLLCD